MAGVVPRPEYPRPQFVRREWLCLNGLWEFELDPGDSGLERGLRDRPLSGNILVPFCPESELSGLGHVDFLNVVWYRREVTIPADWAGQRVLLWFQAVDYDATVWVNGEEVGRHRGGFSPFCCDLTPVASPGESATIVVRARDLNQEAKPRGKQSAAYANHGCLYTRTTGIWQTVWLEPVPPASLRRPRVTPDLGNSCFHLVQPLHGARPGMCVRATLRDAQGTVSSATVPVADFSPTLTLPVSAERRRLWAPGDGHLYDLTLELLAADGTVLDSAESYAGLRAITFDGLAVLINGEPVFQRLVLDQGYYPDGILTAPSDEALRHDIELSLAAGFNGARLHQKVFEERFLYHADRLGYLVWGEFADWGCGGRGPEGEHQQPPATYLTQWLEVLERDYSHPAIVGWCPLNETWQPLHDRITTLDDVTRGLFLAAKAMDPTRPVLDTSGYAHRVREADIYDSHDYDQNPATFKARHDALLEGQPYLNLCGGNRAQSVPWGGQPYFVSEFGGIWWNPDVRAGEASWGYGNRPTSAEEFHTRFDGLCAALLANPAMFAYCYTQLTDVYQEQNGIYRFDRSSKLDVERVRAAQVRPAAVETRR